MQTTKYLVTHKLNEQVSVIVNSLSGAVDIIENRFLGLLKKPDAILNDSPLYDALKARGYIFQSSAVEDEELRRLFATYTTYDRPTMFVICPTYSCNLRCAYCFEGKLTQETDKVLSKKEIDAVFEAIDFLGGEKASIQLFGGEPFLPSTKGAVAYIFKQSVKRGYNLSAVTNGVNLAAFMPLLLEYKSHFVDFQVTIDGPEDIHNARRPKAGGQGSFQDIMRGIDMALKNGLYIRMRVNVDAQNISRLVNLADIITDRGWNKLPNFGALLSPVDDHKGRVLPHRLSEDMTAAQWLEMRNRHPQLSVFRADLFRNLEHIITTLNSEKASFPRFQFCESNSLGCYTFGVDGNIYLCAEAIGDSRAAIGTYLPALTINEAALDQWNGRSILTIEKCRDCSVATLCGGGCAYAALAINGSIDAPFCNNAKETLHAYLDSIKDRLLKEQLPASSDQLPASIGPKAKLAE